MSGDCQFEMTLQEWVERLPEIHHARKEYAALKALEEKFNSLHSPTNNDCAAALHTILNSVSDKMSKKTRLLILNRFDSRLHSLKAANDAQS